MREFILEKVGGGIVPSLVIVVSRGGRVVWAEAFGYADLESRRPATLDSIYKIASVSKPITVTGLMTLVDRGLVALERPANVYLTGARLRAYAGSADDMTVLRLGQHTAGLPTHEDLYYDGSRPPSPEKTIRDYGFAAWEPGTRYVYSNLGTAILGFITEKVSGIPWAAFLRTHVFRPLGMRRTFAELPPGSEAGAVGRDARDLTSQYDYDVAGRFVRTGPHATSHPGGSSMWSSAPDLVRFAEMHINDGRLGPSRVISERSARLMRELTVGTGEAGRRYGFGWVIDAGLGPGHFGHSGGGPGMGVELAAYPEDRIVTVVLTNYFGAMAPEVSRRLAKVMFPRTDRTRPADMPPKDVAATPSPADDLLGVWRGRLVFERQDLPLRLSVDARGVRLGFRPGAPELELRDVTFGAASLVGTAEGVLIRRPGFHGVAVLDLHLRLEGERLVGMCESYAKGYFELVHWVELTRQS